MKTHNGPHALRVFVVGLGVLMLALALVAHESHSDPVAVTLLVVYGIIFVAGILLEHWKYKPSVKVDEPGWKSTDEVFLDPVTGEEVRVWFNPHSGERDYRPVSKTLH